MIVNVVTTILAWIGTIPIEQPQDLVPIYHLVRLQYAVDHPRLCPLIDLIVANIIPGSRHIHYTQCKGQLICHHQLDLHHLQ